MKINNFFMICFALLFLFSSLGAFEISNQTIAQKYNNTAYTENVKESLNYTDNGLITYKIEFGQGLPAENFYGLKSYYANNITVPFFGTSYRLYSSIYSPKYGSKPSTHTYMFINESDKVTLYKGEVLNELIGTGKYANRQLVIKVKDITLDNFGGYEAYVATLTLKEKVTGKQIDENTIATGTFMEYIFNEGKNSKKVLGTSVYVSMIGIQAEDGKVFVTLSKNPKVITLKNNSSWKGIVSKGSQNWFVTFENAINATNPDGKVIKTITLTK